MLLVDVVDDVEFDEQASREGAAEDDEEEERRRLGVDEVLAVGDGRAASALSAPASVAWTAGSPENEEQRRRDGLDDEESGRLYSSA